MSPDEWPPRSCSRTSSIKNPRHKKEVAVSQVKRPQQEGRFCCCSPILPTWNVHILFVRRSHAVAFVELQQRKNERPLTLYFWPTGRWRFLPGEHATSSAALVAMLHNLSTRFAPEMEDLRRGFRTRAYDEIRIRDAPLFKHLTTLFPGADVVHDSGVRAVEPGTCRSCIPRRVTPFNRHSRSPTPHFFPKSTICVSNGGGCPFSVVGIPSHCKMKKLRLVSYPLGPALLGMAPPCISDMTTVSTKITLRRSSCLRTQLIVFDLKIPLTVPRMRHASSGQ